MLRTVFLNRVLFASLILMSLLAACREKDPLLKEPVQSNPDIPFIEPTLSTIVAGCVTTELEQWYENISINAQAFRDESFGYITLSPEAANTAVFRLGDLRDAINAVPVPECMAQTTGILQEMMDSTITAFDVYTRNELDQGTLIERVTQQHQRYDTVIKPALDNALNDLNTQFTTPE